MSNCEIDEIQPKGDEAGKDIKGVFGYSDQRGGLYGWNPEEPFPGYMQLSGCTPFTSEKAYKDAILGAQENDRKGVTKARNTTRTSARSSAAAAEG